MENNLDRIKKLMAVYGTRERFLSETLKLNRTTLRKYLLSGAQTGTQITMEEKILKYFENVAQEKNTVRDPLEGVRVIGEIPSGPLKLTDDKPHFALSVCGNSMAPEFRNKDIVVFRKTDNQQKNISRYDGKLLCVEVDGETLLRKLSIGESNSLEPLNAKSKPIPIGPNDALIIQGEVVRLIREL